MTDDDRTHGTFYQVKNQGNIPLQPGLAGDHIH